MGGQNWSRKGNCPDEESTEYIRARRMTLAAQELSREDVKVIDVAIKYGYESPDSLQSVNTKIWSEWLPALQGYGTCEDKGRGGATCCDY